MSFVSYKLAPKLGNPEKDDIEKKKLPASLNFLQDSILATLLVMMISVAVIMLIAGKDGVEWLRSADGFGQAGFKNWFVFMLWISITLTANIRVLLAGMRMSPIFLVPGFIPLFFDNATIAIFSNKAGGWKAAAVFCTLNGLIQILGSMLAVSMMELTWWQGSADYATIWVAIIAIFKFIGSIFGIPIAG